MTNFLRVCREAKSTLSLHIFPSGVQIMRGCKGCKTTESLWFLSLHIFNNCLCLVSGWVRCSFYAFFVNLWKFRVNTDSGINSTFVSQREFWLVSRNWTLGGIRRKLEEGRQWDRSCKWVAVPGIISTSNSGRRSSCWPVLPAEKRESTGEGRQRKQEARVKRSGK